MIWIILYVLITGVVAFFLYIGAMEVCDYDPSYDFPWPVVAAALWPIGAPLAAAYIAAMWFVDHHRTR